MPAMGPEFHREDGDFEAQLSFSRGKRDLLRALP